MVLRRFLSTSLILFCALILSPVSQGQEKTSAEKIRITYATNSLAFLVTFTARDQGFYGKNGLDYDVVIDAFTNDGRLSADGVDGLLASDKKDGLIPSSVTVDRVADFSLVEEALKELGG
jgi:ABC-type nitrate/sulfonate/bicarbonate transport system substrate-binding protein